MRIALFCATRRGLLFLQKLQALVPEAKLIVFTFREEPHEPPFLQHIQNATENFGGVFREVKRGEIAPITQALAAGFDLLFAVSWRYLIPPAIYQRAAIGSFALHDSMLPKNRGFSPTLWAIINGEETTGATFFEMTPRADEGAIIDQQPVPIFPVDSIAEVLERVTQAYLDLLERNIAALLEGQWPRREQDHSQATYCRKRRPEDNRIDWTQTSRQVLNLIRALTRPYPGAFSALNGKNLTVWSAQHVQNPENPASSPGGIVKIDGGVCIVLTGDGAVRLLQVELEGDSPRPAAHVLPMGAILR